MNKELLVADSINFNMRRDVDWYPQVPIVDGGLLLADDDDGGLHTGAETTATTRARRRRASPRGQGRVAAR